MGCYEKAIVITEKYEEGEVINELFNKHTDIYLALVGFDMDEHRIEPIENHGAIFFNNEEFAGQIQINIQDGKVLVTYGISKKGMN